MMTFIEAVETCMIKKWSTISGRASRSEYWWFTLFITLAGFAIGIVCVLLAVAMAAYENYAVLFGAMLGLLGIMFTVAILPPSICVSVRRLHDIGRSGWWYLINAVPYIGGIVFFIFTLLPSQPEENEYGSYAG
jgi:uncharacterized membrane protein YhaH (DUF805 family)